MTRPWSRIPILFVLFLAGVAALTGCGRNETTTYAVEVEDQLVGTMEVERTEGDPEAGTPARLLADTRLRFSLLGRGLDLVYRETIEMDPATGRVTHYDSDITSGTMKMGATVDVDGRNVDYRPKGGGQARAITVDDDVIFSDNLTFRYLLVDFETGERDSASYRVFSWETGEIQSVDVSLVGADTLAVADDEFECLVFGMENHATGSGGRFWVDRLTADLVRAERSDGITLYLADASARRRVRPVAVEEVIFIDANKNIENVEDIAYMKVKAKIRAPGHPFTAESLNRRGQGFEGTVENGVVDGVFTVEQRPFDGYGAPPFPQDVGDRKDLRPYLEPEMTIESDDPLLVDMAREITAGAADSWIAVGLLARWVGEEIGDEIPGGSARQTFDTRKGECGAHSRLMVAFCRGVGIPARMVMGCMYAHLDRPIFGQHAWVEVYMGEAGWIPLDPTAGEYASIDSGHIRLGELIGFHPEKMEILDYRVADRASPSASGAADTEWDRDLLEEVDADGTRLHVRTVGEGRPAVVILPGFGAKAETWAPLAVRLAAESEVVLIDRAGYGLSEPAASPRTLRGVNREMEAALEGAGVNGPYVLVGHSLGGLLARVYAADHPDSVAGLVLLDPPPVPFILGERFTGLRAAADTLSLDLQRQADAARKAGDEDEAARLGALAAEHRMLFGGSDETIRALGGLDGIPLVVVGSGVPNPSFGDAAGDFQQFWIEQNRELAGLSTRGRFVLAPESTHALNHDAPDVVVRAIRDVLQEARAGRDAN